MKRLFYCILITVFLILPAVSYALPGIDIEAAVGGRQQTPSGDVSYDSGVPGLEATLLDLEEDFGLEEETRVTGRLKIDLPVIPTVYVVAAPMEFKGEGESVGFNFGDTTFEPGSISSKLT